MKMLNKRDNRGLSLIELVIVMAIMAVLTAAVGIGVSLVTNKAADKCATQLKTSIQSVRITTMGKFKTYLKIYMTADGVCIEEVVQSVEGGTFTSTLTYTGDANVAVTYTLNDGSKYSLGDAASPLYIEFDRSSGAMKRLPDEMGPAQAGKYCVEIEISKGNRTRTIKIAYLTGKVSME